MDLILNKLYYRLNFKDQIEMAIIAFQHEVQLKYLLANISNLFVIYFDTLKIQVVCVLYQLLVIVPITHVCKSMIIDKSMSQTIIQ